MSTLERKIALVTGGANGIGKAIVRGLASNGFTVYTGDIDCSAGKKLCEEYLFDEVRFLEMNVTDEQSIINAFRQVYRDCGKLDVLVNNAGGVIQQANAAGEVIQQESFKYPFEYTNEEIGRTIDLNLKSVILCTKYAVPLLMKEKGGGTSSIINISSHNAVEPIGQSLYSAAKAGVIALSRADSLKLRDFGIIVDVVLPGYVFTESTTAVVCDPTSWLRTQDPDIEKKILNHAKGRPLKPEDIALVAYELIHGANTREHGVAVQVDGPVKKTVEVFDGDLIFSSRLSKSIAEKRKELLEKFYGIYM